MKDWIEYELISQQYGTAVAQRSQVPLINHINEGLEILQTLGATEAAQRAFCLHPVLQNDLDYEANIRRICGLGGHSISVWVMALTLEYRRAANAYLCKPYTDGWDESTIKEAVGKVGEEVRFMLIADKRQNMKDFLAHHYGKHERSEELLRYFVNWLVYLRDPLPVIGFGTHWSATVEEAK